MKREMNLSFVISVLKRKILWLFLSGIILAGITLAVKGLVGETYFAKISYYTVNTEEGKKTVDASLISAAQALARDYVRIAESDLLTERIVNRLNSEGTKAYSIEQVAEMIKAEIISNSSVFNITVKGKSEEEVGLVTKIIAENFEEIISSAVKRKDAIFKLSSEMGSELPKVSKNSIVNHMAAGFAAGVALAAFIILARSANTGTDEKSGKGGKEK